MADGITDLYHALRRCADAGATVTLIPGPSHGRGDRSVIVEVELGKGRGLTSAKSLLDSAVVVDRALQCAKDGDKR